MIAKIEIEKFVQNKALTTLVDVRSPSEYMKGKIPGAINIPLFSDEERAHVGTTYKQQSKEKAIALGLKYVQPKLNSFLNRLDYLTKDAKLVIYCARGGMRSHSFAEHLFGNGFLDVSVIEGGYKAFRSVALNAYDSKSNLSILGGYTGSGKTYVLKCIKELGGQTIDLEGLARHKGSAFGGIGSEAQPTIEQFENDLYWQWKELDQSRTIWIEDESHRIGNINIPIKLYNIMRNKPVCFMDIPKEERAKHLVSEYANFDKYELAESLKRISKKLGSLNAKNALNNLEQNKFYEVAICSLGYYDKYYLKGLLKRDQEQVKVLKLDSVDHLANAKQLLNNIRKH